MAEQIKTNDNQEIKYFSNKYLEIASTIYLKLDFCKYATNEAALYR